MLKSPAFVPDIETPLIVSDELTPFDSVTVCTALVEPTVVFGNEILVADSTA